jgi:hypothetical protein
LVSFAELSIPNELAIARSSDNSFKFNSSDENIKFLGKMIFILLAFSGFGFSK